MNCIHLPPVKKQFTMQQCFPVQKSSFYMYCSQFQFSNLGQWLKQFYIVIVLAQQTDAWKQFQYIQLRIAIAHFSLTAKKIKHDIEYRYNAVLKVYCYSGIQIVEKYSSYSYSQLLYAICNIGNIGWCLRFYYINYSINS